MKNHTDYQISKFRGSLHELYYISSKLVPAYMGVVTNICTQNLIG